MGDRASKIIRYLLALTGTLLVVVLFLVYLSFGNTWKTSFGPSWSEFILPVITNVVSTLITVVISLVALRWISTFLDDSQQTQTSEHISREIARIIQDNIRSEYNNLHGDISRTSTEITNVQTLLRAREDEFVGHLKNTEQQLIDMKQQIQILENTVIRMESNYMFTQKEMLYHFAGIQRKTFSDDDLPAELPVINKPGSPQKGK